MTAEQKHEYSKCNDVRCRDAKVDHTHQDQENSSDQNSDRRCLTDGACGASDQHIHRIDSLAVTHGSKRGYAGIHFNTVLCDSELCHISSKCNQKEASCAQRRVHEILSQSAKQTFYNHDCKHTADYRLPPRKGCRKVQCQKQSRYNGAQVIDRLLFMYNLIKYPL